MKTKKLKSFKEHAEQARKNHHYVLYVMALDLTAKTHDTDDVFEALKKSYEMGKAEHKITK